MNEKAFNAGSFYKRGFFKSFISMAAILDDDISKNLCEMGIS
jgi:hypothetical protein